MAHQSDFGERISDRFVADEIANFGESQIVVISRLSFSLRVRGVEKRQVCVDVLFWYQATGDKGAICLPV